MRAYLLIMTIAAIVTFLTTGTVRGIAARAGVVAAVRDRDMHTVPVPRLGGIAIFLGVAAALGLAWTVPFLSRTFGPDGSGPLGVLAAAAVMCVVGVIDDIWGLDAWTKLAGQALAGLVMALLGLRLLVLPINGLTLLSDSLLVPLTVLLVVLTANAVNFVDGLDGLAAGIVAISGTAFFAYSYLLSREASPVDYSSAGTLIAAVTVGAAIGFLPHNLHPAGIFMGDSGALTLGLLLASATIAVTGDTDPRVLEQTGLAPAFVPLLLPFAALLIPLADVTLAVVRRVAAGRSPFSPDRKHLHHRVLELGHSHGWAVALIHAWVALIAFGAAATAFWAWQMVLRVGGGLALVLLVATVVPLLRADGSRRPVSRDERPMDAATAEPAEPAERPAESPPLLRHVAGAGAGDVAVPGPPEGPAGAAAGARRRSLQSSRRGAR